MSLSDEFVTWEKKLAIRRTLVLFTTLWMTWQAFAWAKVYAEATVAIDMQGIKAAATIAAVTFPITYLQKVVLEAYIKSK